MEKILKLRNILSTFDDFEKEDILNPRELQDYKSIYLDYYEKWRKGNGYNVVDINDDLNFEIELLKWEDIDVDYILQKVDSLNKKNINRKEKIELINIEISRDIDSSIELRSKKQLIKKFLGEFYGSNNVKKSIHDQWSKLSQKCKYDELEEIISQYNLKYAETVKYIDDSFKDGELKITGMCIEKLMQQPISFFTGNNKHYETTQKIIERLQEFFKKYSGI